MSTSKKKPASRKTSTGKKTTTRRKKRGQTLDFSWKSEVLLWAVLCFSIVLFIANIGKGGAVGDAVSCFFFGVFGLMSYAFPVALFLIVAFLVSNVDGRGGHGLFPPRAVVKAIFGVVFFVFMTLFFQLVLVGEVREGLLFVFWECAEEKTGGGVLGAFLANGLITGFGLLAAYILDFLVLILSVVFITEKSLFAGFFRDGNKGKGKKGSAKAGSAKQTGASGRRSGKASAKSAEKTAEDTRIFTLSEKDGDAAEKKSRRLRPFNTARVDTKESAEAETAPEKTAEGSISRARVRRLKRAEKEEQGRMDSPIEEPTIHLSTEGQTPWSEDSSERRLQGDSAADVSHTSSSRSRAAADPFAGAEDVAKEPEVPRKRRTKRSATEVEEGISDIEAAISQTAPVQPPVYVFPDISLLSKGNPAQTGDSRAHLQEMSAKLQMTLETFGVHARVTNVICGPSVTQYEVQPEMGVKVSKIVNLADDIKLNLMVPDIRIEAPIPGKAAIGIEVPNKRNVTVAFRDLIESREFKRHPSRISFCVGKDIAGNVIVADIAKMPHLLIAGATGSGKSVCINTIIMSILYKADPNQVKLIMIDPKVVELSVYNRIPHLLIPVVTDPKKAAGALHWAVAEMTERYNKFAEYGVRDMLGYNRKVDSIQDIEDENKPQRMPQIVVIVDELADLMMVAPGDVEDAICRLAQLARAAGIHLILATQRPSVNVITGLIKANMPSRVAFSVTSGVDSRTILDMNGAEKLLGKGDMLFYPQGYAKPLRVQGAFVSDNEVASVVEDIVAKNGQVAYNAEIEERVKSSGASMGSGSGFTESEDDRDPYFEEAARFLIEKEKGSIGMLQRNFKIGFNRAARIMDQLEEAGIVGPEEGTKPRRVLVKTMPQEDE